jgi:hypothetical protein
MRMVIKTTDETAGNMTDPFKPEKCTQMVNCAGYFVKAVP